MRRRTLLRWGYVAVLILVLLFLRAAKKNSLESFSVNKGDTRDAIVSKYG